MGSWLFHLLKFNRLLKTKGSAHLRSPFVSELISSDQNFRDHSLGQRSTITFLSVKNSMASRPCACITPKKLPFHPENGKYAIGAGTPMLMPTLPVDTAVRNLRAEAPDVVKIELALP